MVFEVNKLLGISIFRSFVELLVADTKVELLTFNVYFSFGFTPFIVTKADCELTQMVSPEMAKLLTLICLLTIIAAVSFNESVSQPFIITLIVILLTPKLNKLRGMLIGKIPPILFCVASSFLPIQTEKTSLNLVPEMLKIPSDELLQMVSPLAERWLVLLRLLSNTKTRSLKVKVSQPLM